MYMIEITEDKLHSMTEHIEKGLRHMSKLMQCIEELEDDFSGSGAYGEKGRLGMRNDEEEDPKPMTAERLRRLQAIFALQNNLNDNKFHKMIE